MLDWIIGKGEGSLGFYWDWRSKIRFPSPQGGGRGADTYDLQHCL